MAIPKNIKREHIFQAILIIKKEGIPKQPLENIWVFGLILKMFLYLENLFIMEKSSLFNTKPLFTPERW